MNSLDKFFGDKNSDENLLNEKEKEKFGEKQFRKIFYDILFDILFKLVESLIIPHKEINDKNYYDILFYINATIKLLLSEGDKDYIFKIYQNSFTGGDSSGEERKNVLYSICKKIINNILDINNLRTEWDAMYVNSLIVLLESFGEYKNSFSREIIFKRNNNEESIFEKIIKEFKAISNWGNEIIGIYHDNLEKHRVILLNSLTNCIIEYIEFSYINDIVYGSDITQHTKIHKYFVNI